MRIRVSGGGGSLEMAETLLPGGPPPEAPYAVRAVQNNGCRFRFEAVRDGAVLTFDGDVRPDAVLTSLTARGELRRGDTRGELSLLRLAEPPREALERSSGLYELGDGGFIILHPLEELRSQVYVAYPSGRLGALLPTGDGTFVSGPAIAVPYPVEVSAVLTPEGLEWREGGRVARARRRTFVQQEVTVRNGDVRLAGTLTLPSTPPPHPAVVLLHGGGPQTRDFRWVAPFFTHLGVAVLAYDKRGVGGSTGDWRTATAADLAADALAAVDFLRSKPEIDPRRVGLYGSSNGGWVAPLAASRALEKIAFVIARSASGLPERENIVYEIETDLRVHGFGDDVVAKMRALHEKDMALVRTGGEGWNAYREELSRASAEPWFPLVRLPAKILEMNAGNRPKIESWIAGERASFLRPADLWRGVRCPVLIQIGLADESVPGEKSARILQEALRAGGNADATVTLLPNGSHPLFELPGGSLRELPRVRRFVPGYLEQLHDWILARVVRK